MNGIQLSIIFLATICASCSLSPPPNAEWKQRLAQEVQAMGYGNWIVIADASFPYLDKQGFRTITAPEDTAQTLDLVMNAMEETQHVQPTFFLTRELRSVPNDEAPGIDFHRADISEALHGYRPLELEEVLLKDLIAESSKNYTVLIIKTKTALPYTSVFIDLDSGYWDNVSEQSLREKVAKEDEKS